MRQRGDRGFLQDHKVLGVVPGILSTGHQLLKCFLSEWFLIKCKDELISNDDLKEKNKCLSKIHLLVANF